MNPITPKTSVNPAAISNKRSPYCSPFKQRIRKSVKDMVTWNKPQHLAGAHLLLHAAITCEAVFIILNDCANERGMEFAIFALHHLEGMKVLHGIMVVVE